MGARHSTSRGNTSSINQTFNSMDLSPDDISLLQATWSKAGDHVTLGRDIFVDIFNELPSMRRQFYVDKTDNQDLLKVEKFVAHLKSFSTYIDDVCAHLDDERYVIAKAIAVGKTHAQIPNLDPACFDPDCWLIFARCTRCEIMKRAAVEDGQVMQVRNAWHVLLMRLVIEMKVAFYKKRIQQVQQGQEPVGKNPAELADSERNS